MLDIIKQRLKSKTYWLAVAIILFQTIDQFHGQVAALFGAKVSLAINILWPVLFMAVRELTTQPLSEK